MRSERYIKWFGKSGKCIHSTKRFSYTCLLWSNLYRIGI